MSIPLLSQHKIGVRAGLNYNQLSGPLEEKESLDFGSGFHFGINYSYLLDDKFSFRGELLYIQRGYKQSLVDNEEGSAGVSYIVNPLSGVNFVARGTIDYNLEISNSYLSIPLTFNYQFSKRFEVYGGVSVDFLIGQSARGKVDFNAPGDFFFQQLLDYSYNSDTAGSYNTLNPQTVAISIGDDDYVMPAFVGAYYQFLPDQKVGTRFNKIDSHVLGGINYFINPGFYVGARLEYGLTDLTNNAMDVSLRDVDENQNLITRDDKDNSIGINLSFGFRF